MKKTFLNLAFLISISLLPIYSTYAQELRDLFYCNYSSNFTRFYFISNEYSVGHNSKGNLNYIYLFDSQNLIVDTLLIGDNRQHYLQHLYLIQPNEIYINTLNSYMVIKLIDNKFVVAEKHTGLFPMPSYADEGYYGQNLKLGEIITATKRVGSKKSKKEEIGYQMIIIKDGAQYEVVGNQKRATINEFSPLLNSRVLWIKEKDLLFIPVESASKAVVFNLTDNSKYEINFPKVDYKTQSWNCLYDYETNIMYAIKYSIDSKNQIYQLNINNGELKFIKDISDRPKHITNGKYHHTKIDKESDSTKEVVCHYLTPIYP